MRQRQQLFGIMKEFVNPYNKAIELGKEFLKTKNIAVMGLARNLQDKLESNIDAINSLSEYTQNPLKYFVYENDSTDDTQKVLKHISTKNQHFQFQTDTLLMTHFGQVKDKQRTTNLAQHRNLCLEYAKNNFSDTDYIIVIDLDFNHIVLDGIFHSFGVFSKIDIDAIAGFSYEIKTYDQYKMLWNYDSWAFRWTWWDDLQNYASQLTVDPMVWFGYYHPPIGSDPIVVNSAFGGSCIYKTDLFFKGVYDGSDCEHVTFHKYLTENHNFRMVANPSQVIML